MYLTKIVLKKCSGKSKKKNIYIYIYGFILVKH